MPRTTDHFSPHLTIPRPTDLGPDPEPVSTLREAVSTAAAPRAIHTRAALRPLAAR